MLFIAIIWSEMSKVDEIANEKWVEKYPTIQNTELNHLLLHMWHIKCNALADQ